MLDRCEYFYVVNRHGASLLARQQRLKFGSGWPPHLGGGSPMRVRVGWSLARTRRVWFNGQQVSERAAKGITEALKDVE
jgi:hypothetical protein